MYNTLMVRIEGQPLPLPIQPGRVGTPLPLHESEKMWTEVKKELDRFKPKPRHPKK